MSKWRRIKCILKGHTPQMRVYEGWDEIKSRRFNSGVVYECKKCPYQWDMLNLERRTFG